MALGSLHPQQYAKFASRFPSLTEKHEHTANLTTLTVPQQADDTWYAWPFLDSMYDFLSFISVPVPTGGREPKNIGKLPLDKIGTEVAIVGAGAGGLVAAYELLKIGFRPVIYEASDRIGGRAFSKYFTNQDGSQADVFAEMGSMRVPKQNFVFYYYVNEVFKDIKVSGDFPDPGHVPTKLYYENQAYSWSPGEVPPGPFEEISETWGNFINPIMDAIYIPWKRGDLASVATIWQRYLDKWVNVSFYQAVREGIPQWTTEDLNAFGALGVGSGGFGPLYQVGFTELLRILINMWEVDQQQIVSGMSALPMHFYQTKVTSPLSSELVSLESLGCVRFNSPVLSIQYNESTSSPVITFTDGVTKLPSTKLFSGGVIVATTTREMEFIGMTMPTLDVNKRPTKQQLLDVNSRVGLRNLHLMNSSKMFIRTATKFWKSDPSFTQNIQTDELPRGVYCLDYGESVTSGVVLISYVWGDDSIKLLAMPVKERFELFKSIINTIDPKFADFLVPVNDEILNIDWEMESYYLGAFKLNYPGQDSYCREVYYQFMSALDKEADRGVYLAGDSVSWAGGWTEGALHTGLNCAAAICQRAGAQLEANSPFSQQVNKYSYTGGFPKPAHVKPAPGKDSASTAQ